MADIYSRLLALRRAAGLSQADLAGRLGVSPSAISLIERGLQPGTRMEYILRWAEVCGADLDISTGDLSAALGRLNDTERELVRRFAAQLPRLRNLPGVQPAEIAVSIVERA